MQRRNLLLGLGLPLFPWLSQAQDRPAPRFPRDLGSHPDHAIEWWYVTGQLQAAQRQYGFQLTFFRSRVPVTQGIRSNFAAKQLIFAHAAITDVNAGKLLHDQRIARASGAPQVDLASASLEDTHIQLGDWSLQRQADAYQARVKAKAFSFNLALKETQPMLLQGEQGLSRKGPQPEQASWYYSLPQLDVRGTLMQGGKSLPVQGRAWLDHEWSQSLMHPDAVGWDWIGMNLLDGSALTAFRLRSKAGDTLWAGGSFRAAGQTQPEVFAPNDVVFAPERFWTSLSSAATYPVQWDLRIRLKGHDEPIWQSLRIKALVDNQELDSRQSTGAIYWEGLSDLLDEQGQVIGRGYLEMTGYASPLKL
ncbi:MAG: carotenoid 1,2-hydratase [Rhodoferax sp.]|jgi:predicted secreted hydrolase|nr:carotenoid 1,2-hydratase [Rhodoferax sp.]